MTTFLLAALLFAQAPTPAQNQNGAVAGQILSSAGTPAVGVRVAALAVLDGTTLAAGTEILASLAETDGAGRYRLENILPGRYYIRAGPTALLSYYPGVNSMTGAGIVAVGAGNTTEGINFRLSFGGKVTGNVAAALTLESAIPLSAVLVTSSGQSLETPIGPDGGFEFTNVPSGQYYAVTLPNIGLPSVNVGVAGQDVTGIQLGGAVGLKVSGKISDFTVSATSPARVQMLAPAGRNQIFEAIVDPDGTFAFPWIPPDAYGMWTVPRIGPAAVASIVVADRDVTGIELKGGTTATAFVKVSGRLAGTMNPASTSIPGPPLDLPSNTFIRTVTVGTSVAGAGTPPAAGQTTVTLNTALGGLTVLQLIQNVNVQLSSVTSRLAFSAPITGVQLRTMSTNAILQASINADGTFEFPSVPTGSAYTLATALVKETPAPFVVTDQEISGLVLGGETPTAVSVSGRITGAASAITPLPPKVMLSGAPLGSSTVEAPVGTDGKFEFAKIAPGTYVAQTISNPTAIAAIVVADKDVTGADIVFPLRLEVRGRVVAEDGSKLPPSITITQFWAMGLGNLGFGPTVQADGSFKMSAPAGAYKITMSSLPIGYSIKSISYGSTDLMKAPLKLDGSVSDEVRVTLAVTPPESVKGVVVSGKVNGLPNRGTAERMVRLLPLSVPNGPTAEGSIKADGTFEVPKVPPGTYMLRVVGTSPAANFPLSLVVSDFDMKDVVLLMRP